MARRRTYPKKHREVLKAARHLYEGILEEQGGTCALCPRLPSESRRLDMDHDHKTMAIRGLLCHRCNRALKQWMDSAWLRAAADYLDKEPYTLKEK